MRLVGIDHVQLAMPPGGEDRARAFYRDLLGLPEVAKPPELAVRGGAWFETGPSGTTEPGNSDACIAPDSCPPSEGRDRRVRQPCGAVRLHLGVEAEFRPARKAHPALIVDGLDELVARLRSAGCTVSTQRTAEGDQVYVDDPFGNRIELVSTRRGPSTPR